MTNGKLYLGDSNKIIKKIPTKSVHLILSDIPYGINMADWDISMYNNTNSAFGGSSHAQKKSSAFKRRGKPLNGWSEADKKIPLEYQNWCSRWAKQWLRILKPGASCFIFAGRRYANRCINALQGAGFTFKDMLAWIKPNARYRAQRISSVLKRRHDIRNERKWNGWRLANLRPQFEPILWFQRPYKTGGTITNNVLKYGVGAWNEKAMTRYNTANAEPFSNIISVNTTKDDSGYHPTQKPLNLMKLLIDLTTKKGQLVLDPFMGSGTTCIAAKELQRKYVGIEINKKYFKEARKRLLATKHYVQKISLFN